MSKKLPSICISRNTVLFQSNYTYSVKLKAFTFFVTKKTVLYNLGTDERSQIMNEK